MPPFNVRGWDWVVTALGRLKCSHHIIILKVFASLLYATTRSARINNNIIGRSHLLLTEPETAAVLSEQDELYCMATVAWQS